MLCTHTSILRMYSTSGDFWRLKVTALLLGTIQCLSVYSYVYLAEGTGWCMLECTRFTVRVDDLKPFRTETTL